MASAEEVLANARPLHAHSISLPPHSTTSTTMVVAQRVMVSGMTWVPLVSVGLELERVENAGRIRVTAVPGQQVLMDLVSVEGKSGTDWRWTAMYGSEPNAHEVLVEFCALDADSPFVFSGALSAIVATTEPSAIDLLGRLAD